MIACRLRLWWGLLVPVALLGAIAGAVDQAVACPAEAGAARPAAEGPAPGMAAESQAPELQAAEAQAGPEKPLRCKADFEGGSAEVTLIDQQQRLIQLDPALHRDRGWRCWWFLKVTNICPGETLTLDVGTGSWATPDRASYSLDGHTWHHTAPGQRQQGRIIYRQRIDAPCAWFAWGPPFTPRDAHKLVHALARRCASAEAFELCQTRDGRTTPAVRIRPEQKEKGDGHGPAGSQPPYGVWIIARQHAWESGSSWVCRGLAEWLISDDPRAAALRAKAEVTLVPIMDIDNTAIGAGGKEQKPQDHNRDWSDDPHWPAVRAAMEAIRAADAQGRFDLFIDLHNPGAGDRQPFFYVPPEELLREPGVRNLQRFLAAAAEQITAPLPLAAKPRVSGPNYDPRWQRMSKNWVALHTRPHVVAVTLETPWNTPHSTTEGYQEIGRRLGQAIERYLRDDPRSFDPARADP